LTATYLDSSAIVKLAVEEPESPALRNYLRRRRPLMSCAVARTEVLRVLLPHGEEGLRKGRRALSNVTLVRVNDRVLNAAGTLLPPEIRSLDAIHLATAQALGDELGTFVTYDTRMADAARDLGYRVTAPE
jgi:predicted nucleic acid-binding protein